MTDRAELERLKEELRQLKATLEAQHQRIQHLESLVANGNVEPVLQTAVRNKKTGNGWSLENFIGLRLIHLIGIIVLVIGLSIGVKYAIDSNLISAVLRIILAYAAGILLLVLSIFLRSRYQLFSAILFSGAMASLYFTTYAAFAYYAMLSFGLSFLLMTVFTIYTVLEAIRYNRQEIALLGLVGAYGIPFLISKNSDKAELFFLYISLINIGIVVLCIKKPWLWVGRLAQAITWALFIGWAALRKTSDFPYTGFAFMVFFFLLFLLNGVSMRLFQKQDLTKTAHHQVLVNNIALYFAMLLVSGSVYENPELAIITLILAIVAAVQALLYRTVLTDTYGQIMMASYGYLLFLLFIAFEWNGLTVTFAWLLIAIATFSVGVLRKWPAMRMASIILMTATLVKLVAVDSLTFSTVQKVISYISLGVLLLVVSFLYQKYRQRLFDE